MLWLTALFSGALLGLASCEGDCVSPVIQKCMLNSTSSSFKPPCERSLSLMQCISTTDKECDAEVVHNLKKISKVIDDVCEEGSEKNRKFKVYKDCFVEVIRNSRDCAQSVVEQITGETYTNQEKMKQLVQDACKKMDSILTCFEKEVEYVCKKEGKDFFHELSNPIFKMVKKSCKTISKDGASNFQPVPWFVNLSALLFLFFWYIRN